MNTKMKTLMISVTAISTIALTSQPAMAGGAAEHFSEAAGNSGQAVGHSVAGVSKVTAGVVAIPFAVVGGLGEVSGNAAEGLLEFADTPAKGAKLPITDETISAGQTPAQAMDLKGVE